MKKAFDGYTWIAGKPRAGGTVWEGTDHFLFIENKPTFLSISEVYRRLDFRNVQAVSLRRTASRAWLFGVACLLHLLAAFPLVSDPTLDDPASVAILVVFGVPGLILLISQIIRGPSVQANIVTAVQVLSVRGISRQKEAEKFIHRATELCLFHQKDLPPIAAEPVAPVMVTQQLKNSHIKLPFPGSKLVTATGMSLIVAGALVVLEAWVANLALTIVMLLSLALAGTGCIASLGRNRHFQLPLALSSSLWTATFVSALAGLFFYVCYVGGSMRVGLNTNTMLNVSALRHIGRNYGFPESVPEGWMIVALGSILLFCGLVALPSALGARRIAQS
jgi:hypothetical protein